MKLNQLRNVVAIVERGSLRAASRSLGLAQPAVSRSVRELEEELGVAIFERSKFGMTLTDAGEVFVRRSRGIQADLQRTLDELERFKGEDRGTITVAFSSATLLAFGGAVATYFHRKFPGVRLKIVEAAFPMIEERLRDGLIDLYYGPLARGFSDVALVVEPLFENNGMVIGRKGHPLAEATTLGELVDALWLTTPTSIDADNEVAALFEAAGLSPPKILMQASSAMSLAIMISTSDLLAAVPEQWDEIIKVTGILARLPISNLKAPRICAVRRRNTPQTAALRHLNDLAVRASLNYVRSRSDIAGERRSAK
ncbi:LysR family transcriptional regulator [Sphingomonas koreensis]|nr:LysR family transcriptional regulator [Sphingomonas koreensis]